MVDTTNERCSNCGNIIPAWAAVCPVCENMRKAAQKFKTKAPGPVWKGNALQKTTPQIPLKPKPAKKSNFTAKPVKKAVPLGWKESLFGYNRLLQDIYGEPIRFSTLLKRCGYRSEEIQEFAINPSKLEKYLQLISETISESLFRKDEPKSFLVMDLWYGLRTTRFYSPRAIAADTALSENKVEYLHRLSLNKLQDVARTGVFQEQVCDAYNKIR